MMNVADFMKLALRKIILYGILILLSVPGRSQAQGLVNDTLRLNQYKQEAEGLVRFLQFTLNTLGDGSVPAREKDIIIQESYLKFFENSRVQIEDDLVPDRSVVTNKDVQAYFKDIDFFFREVRFEFSDITVEHQVKEGGELFFLVSMLRYIDGIAVGGDSVRNSQQRFIEINLDEENRVLKIASIYTARLGEADELVEWWDNLGSFWKDLWAKGIRVNDSMTLADAYEIDRYLSLRDTLEPGTTSETEILPDTGVVKVGQLSVFNHDGESPGEIAREAQTGTVLLTKTLLNDLRYLTNQRTLALEEQEGLRDLDALTMLTELRRLTIRGADIYDLSPIRNLTHLEYLDLSGTEVRNLEPLRYAVELKELRLAGTRISTLEALSRFPNLSVLDISNTLVSDLSPISELTNLIDLDLTQTQVQDIGSLRGLTGLTRLAMSLTNVSDFRPLNEMTSLVHLEAEHCPVSDLDPLKGCTSLKNIFLDHSEVGALTPLRALPQLNRIYCDNTFVSDRTASEFRRHRPDVLVVFNSGSLLSWWESMGPDWQAVLMEKMARDDMAPGRELLQEMANIEELDLRNRPGIRSLQPTEVLSRLKRLDVAGSSVADLTPLANLTDLEYLDCSRTQTGSVEPLSGLKRLSYLNISETEVSNFSGLEGVTNLRELYADSLSITWLFPLDSLSRIDIISIEGSSATKQEIARFIRARNQTLVLYQGNQLDAWWRTLPAAWKNSLTEFASMSGSPDSKALHRLTQMTSLSFSDNPGLTSLTPVRMFVKLRNLSLESCMIRDLTPLIGLNSLETLELSQNPVEDLSPLSGLNKLRHLEIDNTLVVELDPLTTLRELRILNCKGSGIKNLKPLVYLDQLSQLDISNTAVRSLTPLTELRNLSVLLCYNTKVSGRAIDKFRTEHPQTEITFY